MLRQQRKEVKASSQVTNTTVPQHSGPQGAGGCRAFCWAAGQAEAAPPSHSRPAGERPRSALQGFILGRAHTSPCLSSSVTGGSATRTESRGQLRGVSQSSLGTQAAPVAEALQGAESRAGTGGLARPSVHSLQWRLSLQTQVSGGLLVAVESGPPLCSGPWAGRLSPPSPV